MCAGSTLVEMFGQIQIPALNGHRWLPPGIRIDLTMYSYSPAFLIQASSATENWKLVIVLIKNFMETLKKCISGIPCVKFEVYQCGSS